MRAVTDIMGETVITTTSDGLISDINAAGLKLFGYELSELLDKPVSQLMPPLDRAGVEGFFESLQAAPEGIRQTGTVLRGLRKTGEELALQMSFGDGTLDGRRFFTAILFDITELKRVDRMKSEFVATVSHELRTPLTSIRGSLGLIAGGVAGTLPDKARALVEMAKDNCERLVRLINDILDIEKIESGLMTLELQAAEVAPLLRHAVALNEGFAAQHQVRLALEVPAELAVVRVDPDRFIQVVTNLLSNAVKFSPPQASVTVRLLRNDGRVRIEVSDHGPGIPESFRGRIFQKFSQADGSDSRQKSGTGLGLSISRAIVARLGGQMGFDSEVGIGTTFFFELPEWRP